MTEAGYGFARNVWTGDVFESEQVKVVLSPEELVLLLGGIDLSQAERRRWHRVMTTPENIFTRESSL
jgi:hypothetical protein